MPIQDVTGLRDYSSASVSNADLLKASFAVTVNGATQLMGDKYRNSNYVDRNYSITNKEVDELFTSYGVPLSDKPKYIDSNNMDHLKSELEKNRLYNESTRKLGQELPIAQYPLMMATSILDPVDLVTMPLGFKALGSVKMLQQATRANNMIKAGASASLSATASEALLADTHNVDTNLAFTAIASSVLGGGLGAFLPITQKAGTIESYGKMLDELQAKPTDEAGIEQAIKKASGYNDFDHIKKGVANKIEGWKKNFVWSPSMLLFKSKNPAARAVSYHADKPSLATSDNGEILPSNSSTAMETKQDLYGEYVVKVMKPLVEDYHNYKAQGGTSTGTEWLNGLGKKYREHIAKIEDDAWRLYDEKYNNITNGVRETDKIYLEVTGKEGFDVKEGIVQIPDDYDQVVISHLTRQTEKQYPVTDPTLKRVQDYYHSQQQIGEAVGMSALKGRNGKTYFNRMYSPEKVEELGAAKSTDILYKAMLNSNATRRETSRLLKEAMEKGEDVAELEIKLKAELKDYANKIVNKILTKNVYNEMSFADLQGITTSTSFYKPRKINIDERLAFDLLENDIGKVTNYYSYKTAPKIALKKHLNIETKEDIGKLLETVEKEGRALGLTPKELAKDADNISTLIDTINGTREMSRNPNSFLDKSVRRFTKFNYITLGGGFGLNTLTEIGTVVMTHGIKAFTKMNPAFQETLNMYKKKPTKKWTNELLGMGLAEAVYRANKVQRYDDLDFFSSSGKLEDLLDKGANQMSEISGLNFLTTFLELTSFSSSINDLLEMSARSGSLSRADQKRLARLGLTADDLNEIAKTNKVEYDENGYLLAYNFEKWGNPDIVEKVRNSMREMVKNAVIQADPTSLPVLGTSSHPMAKLFTQFMRFPMAAHERIMLKGLDEANGRMAVGAAVSTGIMTMIFLLREEAMIQAGFIDERDRKYGLDDDEKLKNLATALSTKMPYLGFTQPVADTFLRYSGMTNNYGRDTVSSLSPTLGRIEGIGDVLQDLQDGNLNSRSASFLKYMTPFNTLPVINEGLNALVKD